MAELFSFNTGFFRELASNNIFVCNEKWICTHYQTRSTISPDKILDIWRNFYITKDGFHYQNRFLPISNAKEIKRFLNDNNFVVLTDSGDVYLVYNWTTHLVASDTGIAHMLNGFEGAVYAFKNSHVYEYFPTTSGLGTPVDLGTGIDDITSDEYHLAVLKKGSNFYLYSIYNLSSWSLKNAPYTLLNTGHSLPSTLLRVCPIDTDLWNPGIVNITIIALGGDNKLYWHHSKDGHTNINNISFTLIPELKDLRFGYISRSRDDDLYIIAITLDFEVYAIMFQGTNTGFSTYTIDKLSRIGFINTKGFIMVPDNVKETFISTSESSDRTFYIRVTSPSISKGNVVNYVTTWGTSEDTATANTFSSKSMTFTAENYDRYNELLEEAAQAEIAACKAMLDIPDVVLPANTSETYTKGQCSYNIVASHSKGSAKNVVVTTVYIDNVQFGTSTTATYATQADADTGIASTTATKIQAAKDTIDALGIVNLNTGGGAFPHTTERQVSKAAGSTTATLRVYVDGRSNIYNSTTKPLRASSFASDVSDINTWLNTQYDNLEAIINYQYPNGIDQTYSIGDIDFKVSTETAKTAGNNTYTITSKCDGMTVDTYNGTLDETSANIQASLQAAVAKRDEMLAAVKTYLTNHVANPTVQVQTTDGWKFNLVQNITKTSNNTTATASAKLDGNRYGTTNGSLRYDTIDNDTRVLWASAKDSEDVLKAIIAECPTNYSEVYTVNSFNYNIGTQYVKVEGETFVTINTMLDGEVWKTQTQNVSVANLASNINSAKSIAATDLEELRVFLRNQTPANSDNSAYVVDGFSYNCGVEYSKNANTGAVTGTVKLDGVTMDTITGTLHAATFASDMSDIITRATTSVNSVKSGLIGLTPDIEEYDKNGTAFNLKVTYTKNANGTITIQPFIDGDAYGSPYIVEYDYTKGDVYRAKGQEFISNMKTSVNQASAAYTDTSETYTVNGLSFTVGIKFEKEPGEALVNVFQMLDGKKVGSPSQVDYDVTNTSNATVQAAQDLTTLKTRLNASPANYANVVTYGGFSFAVGSSFEKAAGEDTVHIKTMLDGVQYGNTINQNFNISDINDLLEVADQYETALKDVLTTVPRDETETFTIRRFNFLLGKHYSKQANSHLVTTMVKLDSVQYDQYHQENFDPSTIGTLTTYNDALMQALKNKLLQVTPDDIHTTYSRNQFNFNIDAYFSKQANSDVVNIEYTIDSGDLSGNSTVTFSSSSTEEELQSAATSLASTMDSTVEEVSSLLHELTYNASEEVAAKVLGPRILSDDNDNS